MRPAIIKIVALVLCSAGFGFIVQGAVDTQAGLFFWLFTGFASMIVFCNFLPGIATFLCMARNLFSTGIKNDPVSRRVRGHHQTT